VFERNGIPRRTLLWGGAAGMVIAGIVLGALSHGVVADVAALSLISFGLVALISLVFYEVGLSEDREREAEERRRAARRVRRRPPPRRRR
jgi:hypothetical protein